MSGRRRLSAKLHSAEDQALDLVAREAESRLAVRRAAREEARSIRMRELEKQNKDFDDYNDGEPLYNGRGINHHQPTRAGSVGSSRRSSEDSVEMDKMDMKFHVKETEDRFKKAMITNAQLDNEKSSLTYQVDMCKDIMEEMDELQLQLQRENRDKYRDLELLKKDYEKLQQENNYLKYQVVQRDELIQENGLVLIGMDESIESSAKKEDSAKMTLLSQKSAQLLEQAGEGSLDVRLKRFAEEKQDLLDQISRLQLDLEEEKHKNQQFGKLIGTSSNGPETKLLEMQRDVNKLISDYKFKLQKNEQEIVTLQGNVARLDGQLSRYRSTSEMAEKIEEELKAEKRKLQRELREAQSRVEELESSNAHLETRIGKLKSTRRID